MKELASAVAAIMPGANISVNKAAQPYKRSYRVDLRLFRELAPHHQSLCILDGTIEELKNPLKSMRSADVDFHNSSFIRLVVLSRSRGKGLLNQRLEWNSKRIYSI